MTKGVEFLGSWRTACRLTAVVTSVLGDRLEGYVLMPLLGNERMLKAKIRIPTWWNLEGVSSAVALTLVDRVRENEKVEI